MESQADKRRKYWLGGLIAFAVFSVLRMYNTIRDGDTTGTTVVIAVVIVALVVVITLWVMIRRLQGLAGRVSGLRPGVTVVPALTASEMLDVATALGVSRKGLSSQGGSPVALALLPDRIEVWAKGDEAPRWWIARSAITTIQVAPAVFGTRRRDTVWVQATTGAIAVQPAYRPLRSQGGATKADLERCVAELSGSAHAAHGA